MRWAGNVARKGERRNICKVLVGNPEGHRPLVRPRRRCEDNIRMDLREIAWDGIDWIDLHQDRDPWRARVHKSPPRVPILMMPGSLQEAD
jgi:hypothetical protein